MSQFLEYTEAPYLAPFQNVRKGELHVADSIVLPNPNLDLVQNLADAKAAGVKYVLVGIPEDIGPRANCGNGGANHGWQSFLSVCLNQQHNSFFDWQSVLLLGQVKTEDLQSRSKGLSPEELRPLCAELDERVIDCLKPIFDSGLEIIVIGGGHNNAYPIISSLAQVKKQQVGCVNMDPHADFRDAEGRHSGNPFRYAHHQSYLSQYWVMGLHEQKNNANTVNALVDAGFRFSSFQDLFVRHANNFESELADSKSYLTQSLNAGIELDVDAIKNADASAFSVAGFSLEQACHYVHRLAQVEQVRYLHLCESAPEQSNGKEAGQLLTQLVYSYLISRSNR